MTKFSTTAVGEYVQDEVMDGLLAKMIVRLRLDPPKGELVSEKIFGQWVTEHMSEEELIQFKDSALRLGCEWSINWMQRLAEGSGFFCFDHELGVLRPIRAA